MGVQDYNYTKPRRPIAAMFGSPGPAVYNIPGLVGRQCHDPRSVHQRYPAYTMGLKLASHLHDISPGPIYLPHAKLLRDGMLGIPKYSITSKRPLAEYIRSPGPAAYFPGKWAEPHKPPCYTFGMKNRDLKAFLTPAPNRYSLPPMIGDTVESSRWSAPAYTMVARNFMPDSHNKTPGPGTYKTVENCVYLLCAPHYSMTARNEPPGDRTRKPGPGAHYPELVKSSHPQRPQYSFGIKHSQYSGSMMSAPIDDDRSPC